MEADMFVDDLITGAQSQEEAERNARELSKNAFAAMANQ